MRPPARSCPNRLSHHKLLVPGTSYPAIARHVKVLIGTEALCGRAIVSAGATGVGATVVDALRVAGVKPIPVTITAVGLRMPKRDPVAALLVIFQAGRPRISPA